AFTAPIIVSIASACDLMTRRSRDRTTRNMHANTTSTEKQTVKIIIIGVLLTAPVSQLRRMRRGSAGDGVNGAEHTENRHHQPGDPGDPDQRNPAQQLPATQNRQAPDRPQA